MTPVEVGVLLRCYADRSGENVPEGQSPAIRAALNTLKQRDLIEISDESMDENRGQFFWVTTPRGSMYVKAICAVPAPENVMQMPAPYPTPE